MKEAVSFQNIYNISVDKSPDSAVFQEKSPEAKVRNLTINGQGITFYRLGEDFSTRFSHDKSARSLCAKNNSDGIVLFELGEKKFIVICELKSATGDIKKALNQAESSYIKLCEALSICEPFDINCFSIVFIITAKDDPRYVDWMDKINKALPADLEFIDVIALENYEHGMYYGESLADPQTFAIPDDYHHNFVNKGVIVLYRTTESDTIVVDIKEFC